MTPEAQDQILELHSKNSELSAEVKALSDKLAKAKDVSSGPRQKSNADHSSSRTRMPCSAPSTPMQWVYHSARWIWLIVREAATSTKCRKATRARLQRSKPSLRRLASVIAR